MNKKNKLAISIKDLTLAYQEKPVLWDIDMTVPKGVLMAIVGPNGAGKTTLLKCILGLLKPAAGSIEILQSKHKKQRKKLGYVPQRGSVDWDFPTTVLDIVLMGRYGHIGWFKRPQKKDKELALDAIEKVGMTDFIDRQISQLSGGQQQRVFLARSLVQDAEIYCMDEPFVGIDIATEKAIVEILKTLRQKGKTVLVVHHDIHTLKEYFDWAYLMNVRQIASGPVKEVITEENLKLAYGGRRTIGF